MRSRGGRRRVHRDKLLPLVLVTLFCCLVVSSSSLLTPKSSLDSCPKPSYMEYKIANGISDIAAVNDKEEICDSLQKMQVNENLDENVNSVDINLNKDNETIRKKEDVNKYKKIRKWEKIIEEKKTDSEESFVLRLLSFNILAQDLLETHKYLYYNHSEDALEWEKRKPLIIQEILESNSHMVCLQEMQEEHLRDFLIPFQKNNYTYLYKKRTNDKKDGLLLLYREDLFNLLEFSKLELYQTNIELLSRDNVGIIAKFSVKANPEIKFVAATTHLLYNPRRNDVRLGQVQLLFAEIERISFLENTPVGPKYLPIVLSGDFNLEPRTGVYRFITEGSIEFEGKSRKLEQCDCTGRHPQCLSNSLIPPYLYVTDECQHFNVLSQRLSGKGTGKVMLRNTENQDTQNIEENLEEKSPVQSNTSEYQKIQVADGHFVTFSSGLLTHPFQFKSVYQHKNDEGKREATTYQDEWITVDYIFYSSMKPIEKYTLPTTEDCSKFLPTIPNSFVGSDHLSLGATFQIKKR